MLIALMTLAFSINMVYALNSDNLVGAWLFEGNDDVIVDSSGNGHDGEIAQGAPGQVGNKYGSAMEFGGADMITVPDDDALDLGNFTLAAWINVDGQSGKWQVIVSKENRGPTGRNYGIFCNINSGVIHYSFTAGGSWHHIAAVYEKPDFKLYLDGVVNAQTSPGVDPGTSDNVLFIGGCDIGDYWMTELIDEVALFSEALSEDDIGLLMDGLSSAVLAVQPLQKITTTRGGIRK